MFYILVENLAFELSIVSEKVTFKCGLISSGFKTSLCEYDCDSLAFTIGPDSYKLYLYVLSWKYFALNRSILVFYS